MKKAEEYINDIKAISSDLEPYFVVVLRKAQADVIDEAASLVRNLSITSSSHRQDFISDHVLKLKEGL